MKRILLYTLLLLSFTACKNETENIDLDYGYEYFPLEIGKYIDYQVDSTQWDFITGANVTPRLGTYQIRELIADTIVDNLGDIVYRIERYKRQDETMDWVIERVWTAKRTTMQAERMEDNNRFIRLIFPLRENMTWDGNHLMNVRQEVTVSGEAIEVYRNWGYRVESTNQAEIINNLSFDEVATITQADDENVIERRYSLAKYAKGIGMIYKEEQIFDTQCDRDGDGQGNNSDCIGLSWLEKAEKGYTLKMEIIGHN